MAAPRPTVPETPKDFWSLVELLKDPEAYAERLRVLEAARAEAVRRIEQIVAAEDIDRLRAQAVADRNMAGEELRRAKADAAAHLADTRAECDRLVAEASKVFKQAQVEATLLRQQATTLQKDAEALAARADATLKEAKETAARGEQELQQGRYLKTTYEDRLARLHALAGQLSALGAEV